MKARMKPANRMTNQQKRAAEQYVLENQADIIRRIFKILVVVLNEEYGFGKVRTGRVMAAINEASEEQKRDEVFWAHIDRACHQIGFDFEDEDWRKGFS